MKILITGITGFLGSRLADILKHQFELIGIKGRTSKVLNDITIKLIDTDSLDKCDERPEIVIMCHAAVSSGRISIDTENLFRTNVQFTEQVIKYFPNAYYLYVSSVSVYGGIEGQIDELSLLDPESEYAVSKLWGEKITSSQLHYGILRLPSLYGIGMKDNTIIPKYVDQALKQNRIVIWGSGSRRQNYLFVDDAINYIQKMIINRSQGIHLATSWKEVANVELAEIICSITGAEMVFKGTDNTLSRGYNNKATREKLNITNEILISEGLREYISWKRKQF